MPLTVHLKVLRADQELATHSFDSQAQRSIKIGRLKTAQVYLEDAKVSRIHAVIELSHDQAHLIDMGSSIGTLLNGAKISKAKLEHGDQIMVGDTTLSVGLGAPAVLAEAPASPVAHAVFSTPLAATPGREPLPSTAPFHPSQGAVTPQRRMTQEDVRGAAVEGVGIDVEEALNYDNKVLELRFYWGEILLGMYHYVRPKQVTIGENTKTDIFLSSENLPKEAFPLIRYRDGDYILSYTSRMEGEVQVETQNYSLLQARTQIAQADEVLDDTYQIKMTESMRALLHWGGATFAMRFVPPAKILPAPFAKNIDHQYLMAIIFSFMLHLVMIITLHLYPTDADALKVDLFGEPDRFAQLILEAPKETKSSTDMLDKIKKQVQDKKEQIAKPVEGKKDKATTKPLDAKAMLAKNLPRAQKTSEEKKADMAKRFSSLLGGGGAGRAGGAGNILGGGGGGSLAGTLQNVIGTAGAGSASAGLSGLGVRGAGPLTGGGLGTSRGIGGIGTSGRLGGGGAGYGAGVGLGAGKARNTVNFETPQVEGALSSDAIKKVINQNRNQVRYCYEVELQRDQNLEGRVLMTWIIGATGAVVQVSVKETSLHNANVEKCLMAKIKTWLFPPPAGGGTVTVNYPFVFKAS